MAAQDAAAELVSLWPALPQMVGRDWPHVRAKALDLVRRLGRAGTDEERVEHTESLLELLLPYPEVLTVLGTAYHRGRRSAGTGTEPDWAAVCRLLDAMPHEQWIRARFDGHARDRPPRAHRTRRLALGVDRFAHPHAFAAAQLGLTVPADADAAALEIDVYGDPEAVAVEPVNRSLVVRRNVPDPAAEPAEALFDITPLRDDDRPVMLMAVIRTPDGKTYQTLPLTVYPARPVEREPLRAPWRTGPVSGETALSLVLAPAGGTFLITAYDHAGSVSATLPHSWNQLDALVRDARTGVGGLLTGPRGVRHETALDIPQEVYEEDLRRVARCGIKFFHALFRPADGSQDLRRVGDLLVEVLAAAGPDTAPRVEIASGGLDLPWHLMYAADRYREEDLSPYRLLGVGSRLTRVPLRSGHRHRTDAAERPGPGMTALIAVNRDIDRTEAGQPRTLVSEQVEYWKRRIRDRAEIIDDGEKVAEALRKPNRPDHLWYFYCHLVAEEQESRTVDAALEFTAGRQLLLSDVRIDAPPDVPLPGAPLVVLNACTSAPRDSALRTGFPAYFLGKGARGVVCTDIEVPTELGAEWARRFFDRLLDGATLGTALHRTARELLERHRNLLCLLYTAHGTADVRLVSP